MAISNFSGNLSDIIQLDYLDREFIDALMPKLGYRDAASHEPFNIQVGETITKSRASLMPIGSLDPINPASNTPLDDGLTTPTVWNVEQYVLPLNRWANRVPDLNIIADQVAIQSQILRNAKNLGIQSSTHLDLLVRNQFLNAYMGGNTRVITTLGSPGPVVHVDDIRGYQYSFANGFPGPSLSAVPLVTSTGATQTVIVGSNTYTLIGATADVTNISSAAAAGGISGNLTFSTNVLVADGTAGNAVVSTVCSQIIRPNGRASTFNLTAGDVFTMAQIQAAVAILENNNVPRIDGFYNCYIDPTSKTEIFNDPNFLLLYRGTMFKSEEFKNLTLVEGLGVRFIEINTAPIQSTYFNGTSVVPFVNSLNQPITVHRPFICGEEALIEGDFMGMDNYLRMAQISGLGHITEAKDIYMITREPIDRQLMFISQSWLYLGGFVVPTDFLTNSTTLPTASNAYYKRGVIIEHA